MNNKRLSKTGLVLGIIYIIASIYIFYYSYTCGSGLCGLAYIIPLTPWPQVLEGIFGLNLPKTILPIFFVVNLFIIYLIGLGFGKMFSSLTKK